ncbi:hypothetical protein PM082_012608 [Marasmius tenuissimus]|nr:hypothetical protein PM082_012608 [Marasmius tenuissimus]
MSNTSPGAVNPLQRRASSNGGDPGCEFVPGLCRDGQLDPTGMIFNPSTTPATSTNVIEANTSVTPVSTQDTPITSGQTTGAMPSSTISESQAEGRQDGSTPPTSGITPSTSASPTTPTTSSSELGSQSPGLVRDQNGSLGATSTFGAWTNTTSTPSTSARSTITTPSAIQGGSTPPIGSEKQTHPNTGTLAGIIIGAILGVVTLVFMVYLILRKRKKNKQYLAARAYVSFQARNLQPQSPRPNSGEFAQNEKFSMETSLVGRHSLDIEVDQVATVRSRPASPDLQARVAVVEQRVADLEAWVEFGDSEAPPQYIR